MPSQLATPPPFPCLVAPVQLPPTHLTPSCPPRPPATGGLGRRPAPQRVRSCAGPLARAAMAGAACSLPLAGWPQRARPHRHCHRACLQVPGGVGERRGGGGSPEGSGTGQRGSRRQQLRLGRSCGSAVCCCAVRQGGGSCKQAATCAAAAEFRGTAECTGGRRPSNHGRPQRMQRRGCGGLWAAPPLLGAPGSQRAHHSPKPLPGCEPIREEWAHPYFAACFGSWPAKQRSCSE